MQVPSSTTGTCRGVHDGRVWLGHEEGGACGAAAAVGLPTGNMPKQAGRRRWCPKETKTQRLGASVLQRGAATSLERCPPVGMQVPTSLSKKEGISLRSVCRGGTLFSPVHRAFNSDMTSAESSECSTSGSAKQRGSDCAGGSCAAKQLAASGVDSKLGAQTSTHSHQPPIQAPQRACKAGRPCTLVWKRVHGRKPYMRMCNQTGCESLCVS